jgi:hypothetical protein
MVSNYYVHFEALIYKLVPLYAVPLGASRQPLALLQLY